MIKQVNSVKEQTTELPVSQKRNSAEDKCGRGTNKKRIRLKPIDENTSSPIVVSNSELSKPHAVLR